MSRTLNEAIGDAGDVVSMLWESQTPLAVVPRVVPEFTNWRDEQLAWRKTAVIFDQSHHMSDLNIKGPDALKLIRDLGVNSFENFPVDTAKQFVAVNYNGQLIGDAILVHLEEDEYHIVGVMTTINWLQYHAEVGDYDVRLWRDDNSLHRQGDPALYRYQIQGPGAMDVIGAAIGQEPPKLKFFHTTRFTIGGKEVRALRHGMAGEPGFELFGPWEDNDAVHGAILEAGKKFGLTQVGGRAYYTTVLESGWLARPLPAIYDDERMSAYRDWLSASTYEGRSSLGGSFHSSDVADYYFTPYDLGYGRVIAFDHDFVGREALKKMVETGESTSRRKVTLVWNGEDLAAAYASLFTPGPGAKYFNLPVGVYDTIHYDRVEVDGKVVGRSTWVGYTSNERAVLSLAVLDAEFAEPGTEVVVVWGEDTPSSKVEVEDHVQVKIRATVQPAPYAEHARTSYRANASAAASA